MYRSERLKDEKSGEQWAILSADSLEDILLHIERERYVWSYRASTNSSDGAGGENDKKYGIYGWAGSRDTASAIETARFGWDRGRELLSESLDASNIAMMQGRYKAEGLDVAGAYPFVPNAVGGDPLCMVSRGLEMARTKPLFRIMVSVSYSAGVSTATIINRGAAILSWVDKLESMGYMCELMAVCGTKASGYCPPGSLANLICAFPIKQAGATVSIDRTAFMLAHPAMLRRLIFACYEKEGDLAEGWSSGYGMPNDALPDKLKVGHSIYFPCLHADKSDYSTPEKAISGVERTILVGLQQEGVEEDLLSLERED